MSVRAAPWKVNVVWSDTFYVVDGNGAAVTGLLDASFTKSLYKDKASSAQAVTVTEIGSGLYYATFTPNATGDWYLLLSHATYGTWFADVQVTNRSTDDLAFPQTSGNGMIVDASGNVQTLLDGLKVRTGTCQAGSTSTTIVLDAGASATTDFYKYATVATTGGTGAGQVRPAYGYNGTTKSLTVSPAWTTTPDNTTTFAVYAIPGLHGLDWSQINAPSTSQSLSNTSINSALTVSQVSGNVTGSVLGNVSGDVVGKVLGGGGSVFTSQGVKTYLDPLWTRSATAQAGSTSTTLVMDSSAGATTDQWKGAFVVITGGTGTAQGPRVVTAYDGTTKTATIAPAWAVTPDATSVFQVFLIPGFTMADVRYWNGTAPNNLVSGRVDASIGAVASGVIAAGSFAANALGAVWDELTASHTTASTFGKLLGTFAFNGSNVKADLQTWLNSAPNALQTGRVDSYLGAVASGVISSGSFAANALGAVWDELRSSHVTTGTVGQLAQLIVRDGTAQAGSTNTTIVLDAGASATNSLYNDLCVFVYSGTGAGQIRPIVGYGGVAKTATVSPAWTTTPDATSKFMLLAIPGVTGVDWNNVQNAGTSVSLNSTLIASVLGSVNGDVQGKVLGGGVSALSGVGVQADVEQWRGSTPNALQTGRVDSYVGALAAAVIAASNFAANAVDSNAFAQAAADKVWSTAVRALTDKANFTLSAAGVQAIWDALTANLTTVGSIGKLLVTDIDATISSRLASASYTAPPSVASIAAAILATPANLLVTDASGRVTVGAMAAGVIDTATVTAGYLSSVAQQTLKEALSGVEGTASRYSLAGAIAKLVNKVTLTPSTLTVYKTDGVTTNYTQTVVEDPNANPVSSVS